MAVIGNAMEKVKLEKHAYLIIAHNEFYLLKQLIEVLDDVRNDLYIHVDKKVKNFDFEEIKRLVKQSQLYFTKRIKVAWGADSMVKCEYILLKEAFQRRYQYYHLLQDFIGKNIFYTNSLFRIERRLLKLQRRLGINRLKNIR